MTRPRLLTSEATDMHLQADFAMFCLFGADMDTEMRYLYDVEHFDRSIVTPAGPSEVRAPQRCWSSCSARAAFAFV